MFVGLFFVILFVSDAFHWTFHLLIGTSVNIKRENSSKGLVYRGSEEL